MQNDQTKLLTQKQLLGGFSGSVGDLEQAVENQGQVGATKGLAASSSNTAKVTGDERQRDRRGQLYAERDHLSGARGLSFFSRIRRWW